MTRQGVEDADGEEDALAVLVTTAVPVPFASIDADPHAEGEGVVDEKTEREGVIEPEPERTAVLEDEMVDVGDCVSPVDGVLTDDTDSVDVRAAVDDVDCDGETVLLDARDRDRTEDTVPLDDRDDDGVPLPETESDSVRTDGDAELETVAVSVGARDGMENSDSDGAGEVEGALWPVADADGDGVDSSDMDERALRLTDSAGSRVPSPEMDELGERDGEPVVLPEPDTDALSVAEPDRDALTLIEYEGLDEMDGLGVALEPADSLGEPDVECVSLVCDELEGDSDTDGDEDGE